MAEATVNGTAIYYELRGRTGEPIVLIHGSWTDHHQWDATANLLSTRFRVLTFDRRGHSLSRRAPTPGTRIDEDVADAADLIDQLDLAPAHLAGNSFGSIIALRLGVAHPGLVRSMFVHEPPLFDLLAGDPKADHLLADVQQRLAGVIQLLDAGELRAGAERFVDTVAFGPGTWRQLPPEIQETYVVNAPTFLDETREPGAFGFDRTALARFGGPCLLSQGEQSPAIFRAIVDKLAAALPDVQRRTFTAVGHVPHMNHPAQYVAELTAFIAGQSRARPARPELPEERS
jgi:pimeloyl-ACP methyl ester carboxylesterase